MAKLSPKAKIKWGLNYIIFVGVLIGLAYVLGPIIENIFGIKEVSVFNLILLFGFIILIPYLIYIEIKYRRFSYILGDKEIIIKRGIINISQTVVPYERIQNINSEMDIICNILGIAKIKIETAGSNLEDSEIELPGIENPQEFMRFIMMKVEKMKHKEGTSERESEEIEKNKEKIESIEKNISSIKEMLSSLSHRFMVFEGQLNDISDRLERLDKTNSMFSSRIAIVEENQQGIENRINEIVEYTNTEIEEVKKAIEKIKEMKKKIRKSRGKKKKED